MNIGKSIVLSALLSSGVLLGPTTVDAQTSKQISDAMSCTQGVADAKTAKEEGPDISDRAAKTFDSIVELAMQRCTEKEYKSAGQLLHIAKSMVASE